MRQIHGVVSTGAGAGGDSLKRLLPDIRRLTGLASLLPDTLTVRVPQDYTGRADYTLEPSEASLNRTVTLERCQVRGLDAIIVRTTANTQGDRVLEIMAEVRLRTEFGMSDGDRETIEVFTDES
jgi:CTP-dependent riboflavin kinase